MTHGQAKIGMKIQVHLRDTKTGLSGVVESYWPYGKDGLRYQYGDGNYGCDCNRICFLADVNAEFDALEDLPDGCNSGPNRIAIDKIEDETGRLLYTDGWRA